MCCHGLGLVAHGLTCLRRGVFDRKGLMAAIQRQLWREDPRALVSIRHNC